MQINILNTSNLQLFKNIGYNVNRCAQLTRYKIQVPTIQLKTLCHFLAQFNCLDTQALNICNSLLLSPGEKRFEQMKK